MLLHHDYLMHNRTLSLVWLAYSFVITKLINRTSKEKGRIDHLLAVHGEPGEGTDMGVHGPDGGIVILELPLAQTEKACIV